MGGGASSSDAGNSAAIVSIGNDCSARKLNSTNQHEWMIKCCEAEQPRSTSLIWASIFK